MRKKSRRKKNIYDSRLCSGIESIFFFRLEFVETDTCLCDEVISISSYAQASSLEFIATERAAATNEIDKNKLLTSSMTEATAS